MIKRIALLLLVTFFYVGCKKYPDGPLISLRTKEQRLKGNWEVEYFSIDNYDSTTYLKSQPIYGTYSFTDKSESPGKWFGIGPTFNGYNAVGYWKFSDNKENVFVHIDYFYVIGNIGPFGATDVTWEIRKLKNKELWLKSTYLDKEYFVKFKQ